MDNIQNYIISNTVSIPIIIDLNQSSSFNFLDFLDLHLII